MYSQNLLKIITPVKATTISRLNKTKKWNPNSSSGKCVFPFKYNGDVYNDCIQSKKHFRYMFVTQIFC